MIPYGRQFIDEQDIASVVEALRSDFLTTGPLVDKLEQDFCNYLGSAHAVAVSSATAGLHLAMKVLEISEGDKVLTSANTFLASANCALFEGAEPVFCDVDPATGNMTAETVKAAWVEGIKAVVVVHYAGQPCDIEAIHSFAQARGARVVEDASHALGSSVVEKRVFKKCGAHGFADLSVFSLHPVKTITSGEGGIVTTSNAGYAEMLRRLRHHGIVKDASAFVGTSLWERGPWYHEMQDLGYNYRLSDIHCALGISQLSKIEPALQRRRDIHDAYTTAFAEVPWINTPVLRAGLDRKTVGWHLYSARFDWAVLGMNRTEAMGMLESRGVGTQVLYIPVYLQPYYQQRFGFKQGMCAHAEAFYEASLALPLYFGMGDSDVSCVIESVKSLQHG